MFIERRRVKGTERKLSRAVPSLSVLHTNHVHGINSSNFFFCVVVAEPFDCYALSFAG